MRKLILLFILTILLVFPASVSAYYSGMPASLVIGQTNFTDSTTGVSQTRFANLQIRSVFVDPTGRLIIPDTSNNRVLIYSKVPTSNGAAADLVLGQPDFTSNSANNGGRSATSLASPTGVWSDGNKLFVTDQQNHRVLLWNTFPTQNGQAADVVIGQTNFTSADTTCDAQHTRSAHSVLVHNGRLVITAPHTGHNRIMIWNSIPTTNGASADVVIGQPDFTTCTLYSASASSVNSPRVMAMAGEKLIVPDNGNKRILIWNTIPTTNNVSADVVIGQPDFTSSSGRTTVDGLSDPMAVSVDNGRLFIADNGTGSNENDRVLIYNKVPTSNGAAADLVLGSPNFTDVNSGTSATQFMSTLGVYAKDNIVFVSDSQNARVLIFKDLATTPSIGIKSLEAIEEGKRRLSGNIHLGETGKYTLHDIVVSINGGDQTVTHIEQAFSDTNSGDTVYDWYHDFNPWDNYMSKESWNDSLGFTYKVTATSQNGENSSLFYFSPFNLNSVSGNTVTFSVPKDHVDIIKNEVDHFEVWNKLSSNSDFTKVDGDIPTSVINDDGVASVTLTTSGDVRIEAISKSSGWVVNSNTVSGDFSGSYINPNNYSISASWFPLQINSISGVTRNILSSFSPSGIATNYYSSTYNPVFSGIAFDGTTVAMRVTNANSTEQYTDYSAQVIGSEWSIQPKLYTKSIVNLSVYDSGRYNQILPLTINISQ